MSQSTIGSVTHGTSGIGDFRFLNPFYKMDHGEKGAMYGTRYGYAQFIYIAFAFISLIIVAIYSNSKTVLLQVIILFVTYFFMYYNLSCYLVPNNHDRCTVLVFLMILFVIASTLLSILSSSILKDASNKLGTALGSSIVKKDKPKTSTSTNEQVNQTNTQAVNQTNTQEGGKYFTSFGSIGGYDYSNQEEKMYGNGEYKHNEEDKMYGNGGYKYNEEDKMVMLDLMERTELMLLNNS